MEKQDNERWVEVYKFYDEIEKEALEIFFKDRNIPIDIISRDCSAYDGLFKSSTGAGIIRVEENYVDLANEIIADFEKAKQIEQSSITNNVSGNISEAPPDSTTNDKKSSLFQGIIIGLLVGIIIGLSFNALTRKSSNRPTSWDTNGDGLKDAWGEYSGGKLIRYTSDQNFDRNPDRWSSYENGLILSDEVDSNRDNQIDTWHFYDPPGEISRLEVDIDHDSKVEYIEYYKNYEKHKSTLDNDNDGNIDRWEIFENGSIKERMWSFNNDHIIDKKALYENGRKIKELYDRNRDGSFDEEITLDQFERILKKKKIDR
jgi:hypothetical protein